MGAKVDASRCLTRMFGTVWSYILYVIGPLRLGAALQTLCSCFSNRVSMLYKPCVFMLSFVLMRAHIS